MTISCNINKLIKFLQEKKEEGYKTVELIDDARGSRMVFERSNY